MKRVIPVAWAVGVVALSLVPLAAAYAAWWASLVLIGCVLVPTALVALGRRLRLSSGWIAVGVGLLAVIAGAAVGAAGTTAPADTAPPGARVLGPLAPLVDLIPRLLTAPRPAPADIGYLVPAALLAWAVALAVALAGTATGRARIAPLIGAVVLQVAGALLTAGDGDPYGFVAMASIALILLGWVTLPAGDLAPRARTTRTSRAAWVSSAIAALVIGGLALPAAALTVGDRFEPRTLVAAPRLPAQASNPLPDVAYWNLNADQVLFTLTAASGAAPQRIRLAVLPDFDGAAWTLDGALRQVGVVEDPDLAAGPRQQTLTYRIDVGALGGVWLPSLGRAQSADDAGILMDTATGSLVRAPGVSGRAVTVTALIDAPSDATLARAGVPPATEAARYLNLPAAPDTFIEAAAALTDEADTRWQQVTALADFVRADRTLDQGAPSGASYGRLLEFLFSDVAAGGQVGTTEQFAASFAVLARAVGIPTRLVVGFSAADAGAAAATTFTGADARVWAEVYLSRAGWVTVDPSPDAAILTEHTPPAGEVATPTPAPTSVAPSDARSATAAPRAAEHAQPWTAAAAGIVITLTAVAFACVGGLAALRLRRRLRWRAAGARGAWAQVLDACALAGHVPALGALPEHVVAYVAAAGRADETGGGAVTPAEVAHVAHRAQREAWAPEGHGRTGEGSSAVAYDSTADAWGIALRAERALRAHSTWWRRLVWHISPRALREAARAR